MRSTLSLRQRGFVAGRTKQFGVFSPVTLGVGWDPLDKCQLPCDSQPCCPRHSLTHLRAGPQTPKYPLVVALGLSKQNSRWGRWQGSQGHISILPHLSVNLDLDIQKLPLHLGGPSSQLWLFLFPHSLSRIPALVNNVPWTHYRATVLKMPVYFEANISSWRSQFLSEISQREKDR